jgi:hypothetical protein
MRSLTTSFVELAVIRGRLLAATSVFKVAREIEDREIVSGNAIVEMMKQHNARGGTDEQWARIQLQWEAHTAALKSAQTERKTKAIDMQHVAHELLLTLSERMAAIYPLQVQALIAAREDLGLPLDEAEYLKMAKESYDASKAAMDAALQKMAIT